MSADVQLVTLDAFLDSHSWFNPLHCLHCRGPLVEPVSLPCHHVFCGACVQITPGKCGNASVFRCEVCGKEGALADGKPNLDQMVRYLVDSTQELSDSCANCDQMVQPMFFCETCQQPLCFNCKDQTHQAKMFSSHIIVTHEERIGVKGHKMCKKHGEPMALFCSESKRLICIKCFQSASLQSRSHCMDLALAHKVGWERLDKAVSKLKTFQQEVKDQVLLHKKLLEELSENKETQTSQLMQLCQEMVETLIQVRDQLMKSLSDQFQEREAHFRSRLRQSLASLPSIQLYLLSASILCSSANQLDFLDFSYDLMKRMSILLSENQDLRPSLTSQLDLDARGEFSKALEPFLGLSSMFLPSENGTPDPESPGSLNSSYPNRRGRWNGYVNWPNSTILRYHLVVDLAGAFGDEFAKVEGPTKEFREELRILSRQVQDMQKDMTLRRCLIDPKRVSELRRQTTELTERLEVHSVLIQKLQPRMQQIWQEELDRVRRQQQIFRQQVETSIHQKSDVAKVLEAMERLSPFAQSISSLAQLVSPARTKPPEPAPMEQICNEIQARHCDSESRVQAIAEEEEKRRLEMERQKEENSKVFENAKKQLKPAPKDHPSRKKSAGVTVVDRERSRGGRDPALLSPNSILAKKRLQGSQSPRTDVSSPSDLSSLDDSFETPTVPPETPTAAPETPTTAQETPTAAQEIPTVPPVPPMPKNDDSEQLSISLPTPSDLFLVETRESRSESNPESSTTPVKTLKVAPTLPKEVEQKTLDAREALLASLKEKVQRIDVGASNSPERELQPRPDSSLL